MFVSFGHLTTWTWTPLKAEAMHHWGRGIAPSEFISPPFTFAASCQKRTQVKFYSFRGLHPYHVVHIALFPPRFLFVARYPTPVVGLFPFWVCSRGYLSSKHWKEGFFFDSIQDKIIKWQHQTVFEMRMIFQCFFGGTFSLELLIIWTWYQPICARKDSYPRTIIFTVIQIIVSNMFFFKMCAAFLNLIRKMIYP